MALIWIAGHDRSTTVLDTYTAYGAGNGSTTIISTAAGMNGSYLNIGGSDGFASKDLPFASNAGPTTLIVGFRLNFRSYLPVGYLLRLRDNVGGTQFALNIRNTDGRLLALRGDGATLLGTSSAGVAAAAANYIELKVKIDGTIGTVDVKINGVNVLALTGQNTKALASYAGANQIQFANMARQDAVNIAIDDLWVCDTTGSINNDFLGDLKVETLLPNGDGTSSQLVGSDGNSTNNYLLVDEVPPNDDTDYVESSTVANKDSYAFGNLVTTSGTVFGVQTTIRSRKDDAGARSVQSVALLSGTEVLGASTALGTTYANILDVLETKPGGGAWAISDVNAAEFGVKVSA